MNYLLNIVVVLAFITFASGCTCINGNFYHGNCYCSDSLPCVCDLSRPHHNCYCDHASSCLAIVTGDGVVHGGSSGSVAGYWRGTAGGVRVFCEHAASCSCSNLDVATATGTCEKNETPLPFFYCSTQSAYACDTSTP